MAFRLTVSEKTFRLPIVRNLGKKPIIGILGGIGAGKTTVANEFVKLGCKAIDADKIAHDLLDTIAVKEKILNAFGPNILDSAGKIDCKKLAGFAFCDSRELSCLNNILHPLVLEHAEKLIAEYNSWPEIKAIVLDMPLLLEVGWQKRCDNLIFVDCDPQIRADRAKKRWNFDKNQLKIRENFQISLDKKAAISDNTVNSNSDFSALVKQVNDIFYCIINKR